MKTECSCEDCVSLCRRNPGWGTPDEIRKLIEAGHGGKLMVDWWGSSDDLTAEDGEDRILILCPASRGYERRFAKEFTFWDMIDPSIGKGECTFLIEGRCAIHEIKPAECRSAFACQDVDNSDVYREHLAIAQSWNNAEARALVAAWREEHGA